MQFLSVVSEEKRLEILDTIDYEIAQENWATTLGYYLKKSSIWVGIPSAILTIFGDMPIKAIGLFGILAALLGYGTGKGLQKLGLSDVKKGLEILFNSEPIKKYMVDEIESYLKEINDAIKKEKIKAHVADTLPSGHGEYVDDLYWQGHFSIFYKSKDLKKYKYLKVDTINIKCDKYTLEVTYDENDIYRIIYHTNIIFDDPKFIKENWYDHRPRMVNKPHVDYLYCDVYKYIKIPTLAQMKKNGARFEERK